MAEIKNEHKDLRFLRTEKALIDAIRELLDTKDFDAITINDICIHAAVSRTAFYQHYEDKYALVDAWIKTDIKPPSELFSDDTLEEYFTRLLAAEMTYRNQVLHLVRPDGNRELQWRTSLMWSDGFLQYYKKKQRKGARFVVPYEMMAIYNCSGIIHLITWNILNGFRFSNELLVAYIVHKMRQSNDLIHL